MEFVYIVSDTTPNEIEDLKNSVFDTHSPLILSFPESQRGKNSTLLHAGKIRVARKVSGVKSLRL